MPNKSIVKICDWCKELRENSTPSVQTRSVDVADVQGKSRAVASRVRCYHTGETNCYGELLAQQRRGSGVVASINKDSVSKETQEWSDAFDMSALDALTGQGRKRVVVLTKSDRVNGI